MIFARATEEGYHKIKDILVKYCSMSGQLVNNLHKFVFQFTQNVDRHVSKNFASIILQIEETLSLGKYLGCLIICSKVTNNIFLWISKNK